MRWHAAAEDPTHIGVAHGVLDHQLVDVDGMRCGKVDDVALHVDPHTNEVMIAGVYTGPGALRTRHHGSAARYLAGLAGERERFVDWRDVASIHAHVQLACRAPERDLARGEQTAAHLLDRITVGSLHPSHARHLRGNREPGDRGSAPDGVFRLSQVLGRTLADGDGNVLGTVHEVVARRSGELLGPAAGYAWVIDHVELGASGLAHRLGRRVGNPRSCDTASITGWGGDLRCSAPTRE